MVINGKNTEDMSLEELGAIRSAVQSEINARYFRIRRERKESFQAGQTVMWMSGGTQHEGKITRRNNSSLSILENSLFFGKMVRWKVSYHKVWDPNAKDMKFTYLKGKTF